MSINIRFRKTSQGLYSSYIDIYSKGQREYFYPDIIVTEDYSQPLKDRQGKTKKDASGKPIYPKVKPEDKDKMKSLERIKLEKEVDLANNRFGFGKSGKKIFMHDYFNNIASEKKKGNAYCQLAKRLEEYVGDHFPLQEFDEFKIKGFFNFMRKRGCKENTIQTNYYSLIAGLQIAVREKIITVNPKVYLSGKDKPTSDETKRDFLTLEELKKLKATPFPHSNKQIGEAFLFACLTGLRISDLAARKHSEIIEGVLGYRQKKSSREFHYLPLNKQALELIERQPLREGNDRIFWKLPKHPSCYNRYFQSWANDAGIDKYVTWHVARHTHATILLTLGTDIYIVSKILGHSNVNITQRYAKVITKVKQEAVDRIPNLEEVATLNEAI